MTQTTIILDQRGRPYVSGTNTCHRLGLSGRDDQPLLVPIPELSNIRTVVDSSYHMLALNDQGQVWAWGANECGQLGLGDTHNHPSPVPLDLENIQSVACTDISSAAVDSQGRVWFWGGEYNYEGARMRLTKTLVPTHIRELDGAKSLTSNEVDFTILSQDGQVKTWGDGCFLAMPVIGLPEIVMIAQGENHYLALDKQGYVWSWGTNIYLLGYRRANPTDRTPQVIPELPPIVAISSGHNHALALDNQGYVWSWGTVSELTGRTISDLQASIPMPITELDNIVEVKCRQNTSVVLRADGAIFTWGFDIGTYVGHTFVHQHERLNIPLECDQCHLEC